MPPSLNTERRADANARRLERAPRGRTTSHSHPGYAAEARRDALSRELDCALLLAGAAVTTFLTCVQRVAEYTERREGLVSVVGALESHATKARRLAVWNLAETKLESAEIRITVKSAGSTLVLEVWDDGPSRVRKESLGLRLAHAIVSALCGRLNVVATNGMVLRTA